MSWPGDITWLLRNIFRDTDNTFRDTDSTSHTTNPKAISKSAVPVNANGQAITSLRNRYHFPSAATLPHDDDIDENYFRMDHIALSFLPQKHWAYLGEITEMRRVDRLNIMTRDMAGNTVPVWLCSEFTGNGRPLLRGDWRWAQGDPTGKITEAHEDGVTLKVGYTLVISYAELRFFDDGNKTCGLRIDGDEKAAFKVIPYSLDEILAVNDTIVSQKLPGFTPTCSHCKDSTGQTPTLFCARCRIAHYCNKLSFPIF